MTVEELVKALQTMVQNFGLLNAGVKPNIHGLDSFHGWSRSGSQWAAELLEVNAAMTLYQTQRGLKPQYAQRGSNMAPSIYVVLVSWISLRHW